VRTEPWVTPLVAVPVDQVHSRKRAGSRPCSSDGGGYWGLPLRKNALSGARASSQGPPGPLPGASPAGLSHVFGQLDPGEPGSRPGGDAKTPT